MIVAQSAANSNTLNRRDDRCGHLDRALVPFMDQVCYSLLALEKCRLFMEQWQWLSCINFISLLASSL